MKNLPEALPRRCWLAHASVPPALLDGAAPGRVSVLLEEGRIAAVEAAPQGDAPVFDLRGATLLSAFVDPPYFTA